ncbi:MAG: acetylxylan esterase, partial [bacterium]|nr:acetylxylan esterase [bacterium]
YKQATIIRQGSYLNAYEKISRMNNRHPKDFLNRYLRVESQLREVEIDMKASLSAITRGHRFLCPRPAS